MNFLNLLPNPCLLDDLCSRIENVITLGPLTPSALANKRLIRKSVRLQLLSYVSSPRIIEALRGNIPLISGEQLDRQDLAFWQRTAELEHWLDERSDIDADDAILLAKLEIIAFESVMASIRGG